MRWLAFAVVLIGAVDALAQESTGARTTHGAPQKNWQREYQALLNLPAATRERIRKVDRELRDEDSDSRARYLHLLQRYSDWLDRLPPEQRRYIEEATSNEQRIQRIREIKEQQWIANLPKADRDAIAAAQTPQERSQKMDEIKKRLQQTELEWQVTLAHIGERQRIISFELGQWKQKVLEQLKGEERRQKMREWQNLRDPSALKSLYDTSQRLGIPVPERLEKLRLYQQQPPPPVERAKLMRFMAGNDALRREFEPRLKDPEEREQALLELIERYWQEHRDEWNRIREMDEQIRKKRTTRPANP
jgi:hypothetical protein